jgi:hypothetical protein
LAVKTVVLPVAVTFVSGEEDVIGLQKSTMRVCPDCGSERTTWTKRGLIGPTDESDQFYQCRDCGRITFEIVARTSRDLKVNQIAPGKVILQAGDPYVVSRVLKVGLDEFLVYLRPASDPPRIR